jgi:hypothetical protein
LLYLLNWRLWLAGILLVSYPAMYLKGRHDGKQVQQQLTASAIEKANAEVRRVNELRQDRVDEAAKLAAARELRIRADADRARSDVRGLRDTLDAVERASESSIAASNNAVRALGNVVESCSSQYQRVAEEADRATSEAMTLRRSWPK